MARTACLKCSGSGIEAVIQQHSPGFPQTLRSRKVTVQHARILFSSKARAAQKRSIHRLCEHLSSTATPLGAKGGCAE